MVMILEEQKLKIEFFIMGHINFSFKKKRGNLISIWQTTSSFSSFGWGENLSPAHSQFNKSSTNKSFPQMANHGRVNIMQSYA
jgi:hypothetical protein